MYYDYEIEDDPRWILTRIHYTYDPPTRGNIDGRHYIIRGQINLDRVEVLAMSGYDRFGDWVYDRSNFGTWQDDMEACAFAHVLDSIVNWEYLAEELVNHANIFAV